VGNEIFVHITVEMWSEKIIPAAEHTDKEEPDLQAYS
jgi:hypothetical protein